MTTDLQKDPLYAAARAAIDVMKAIPLGEPFASADEAATNAIGELQDPARQALFPPFVRGDADTIAAFSLHSEMCRRENYADGLADLHEAALDRHPELAEFIRSGMIRDRIAFFVAAMASALAKEPAQHAADEIGRFERKVAMSLVGEARYEPHATTLALDAPSLLAELEAERARRTQFAAAEAARIAHEEAAVQEAIESAERQRRDSLIEFFGSRAGIVFVIGNRAFTGKVLAGALRGEGIRDSRGDFVTPPTIDALDLVRSKATAAEAVA